jgi:hypothetical protein
VPLAARMPQPKTPFSLPKAPLEHQPDESQGELLALREGQPLAVEGTKSRSFRYFEILVSHRYRVIVRRKH